MPGRKARLEQLPDGTMVDRHTGELYDADAEGGTFVYFPHRPRLREAGFMSFQAAFRELSRDRELRGNPRAVLDYMLSELNWENWIAVSQSEISKATGIDKYEVSRAVKMLVNKQVLLVGPKLGRSGSYRLNSKYGWKGSIRNLEEYRTGAERNHLELINGGLANPSETSKKE
jgi:hypothetical protein